MHIESKLTRSAARRLDLAAGRVRLGKLAGESQGSNIATMRKIDAIGSFE